MQERAETLQQQQMAAHKAAFLGAFRLTGNVTLAAQAAGLDRRCHSRWKAEDPDYAEAFADAVEESNDHLEGEARRRAYDGVDEPVYGTLGRSDYIEQNDGTTREVVRKYTGQIGTIRKYSDTLLIFLLKGNKPEKFKERLEHTGKGGAPIKVEHSTVDPYKYLTEEDLADMEARFLLAQQRALAAAEPGT